MIDPKTTEVWFPVEGHEGSYEVSSFGRVRSLDRPTRRGKMLATAVDHKGSGYRYVGLAKDGHTTKVNVHTLVLRAFVGPRPEGMQCLHDDGDRTNPRLSNLKWGTQAENMQDKVRHGTHARGERGGRSVMTNEVAQWVRESHQSSLELSAVLECASSTVRAIRLGQNRAHC